MLNKKEILNILIAVVSIAIAIGLFKTWNDLGGVFLIVFLVIMINVVAKKGIGYYLDSNVEIDLWKVKRYGFRPHQYFKKPLPTGIFFPFIFSILSYGAFTWLASLCFEVKPKIYRAAKRHGIYAFSDFTEFQIGLIAAVGIAANLLFAVIGYLTGFTFFTKINIWFAFFNMIPISNLDGNKIFFGSLVLWSFLGSIILIGIAYIFLIV